MRSASEFMSATLNDVLSMQKIEEGKMELEKRNFNLPDAVTKVFSAFRGAAVGKDLNLQLKVAPGFPHLVLGDRFKIEHVIANLLSNAIKFSPRGAVVEVALSEAPHNASRGNEELIIDVVIDVKDHGPGISAEDQLKLFNNFVQIDAGELQQGAVRHERPMSS
jgi:signal transduction histidine kinase